MVESYPMINGKGIHDPESGYDPVIYWENRDPRFKTTIAYNGCLWELSGKTGRKQWTYVGAEVQPSASGFIAGKRSIQVILLILQREAVRIGLNFVTRKSC